MSLNLRRTSMAFDHQFDSLVNLYKDKFAAPAKKIMDELSAPGVLNPKSPFREDVQWTFWEPWHHEGRHTRHGASMMGPNYTHWQGMYEVSKHFYLKFLPEVQEVANRHGRGREWKEKIAALLQRDECLHARDDCDRDELELRTGTRLRRADLLRTMKTYQPRDRPSNPVRSHTGRRAGPAGAGGFARAPEDC